MGMQAGINVRLSVLNETGREHLYGEKAGRGETEKVTETLQ